MSEPVVVADWEKEFHVSLLRKKTGRTTSYEAWSGKQLLATAPEGKGCLEKAKAYLEGLSPEWQAALRGPVVYVRKVGGREL